MSFGNVGINNFSMMGMVAGCMRRLPMPRPCIPSRWWSIGWKQDVIAVYIYDMDELSGGTYDDWIEEYLLGFIRL